MSKNRYSIPAKSVPIVGQVLKEYAAERKALEEKMFGFVKTLALGMGIVDNHVELDASTMEIVLAKADGKTQE